jgi:hypothetical protein
VCPGDLRLVLPWDFVCTLGFVRSLGGCDSVRPGGRWHVCALGIWGYYYPRAACEPRGWCVPWGLVCVYTLGLVRSLRLRVYPRAACVPWGFVCTLGLVRSLRLRVHLGAACVPWGVVTLYVPGAGGYCGTLW